MSAKTNDQIASSLGTIVLRYLVDEIKTLPTTWQKMPEESQGRLIERLADSVDALMGDTVRAVAAGGFIHFGVALESLTVKDGIKVVLTLPQHHKDVEALVERVGQQGTLVLVNPDVYFTEAGAVQPDKEQPDLPMGVPPDNAPADPNGPTTPPPVDNAHVAPGCEQFAETPDL